MPALTPPWLPLRPDLPGREAEIARALATLGAGGAAGIQGAPGIGKTAIAGAVAARFGRRVLAVNLAGCVDEGDVTRALGAALRVHPVGDEGAALDALRGLGPTLLVADDVADEAVVDLLRRVAADAADVVLLVVSEAPLLGDEAVFVGPLPDALLAELGPPDEEGRSPLWARVAAAMSTTVPLARERLQARAAALAAWPTGLAGPTPDLPAAALLPDLRDRVVLRRGLAARLSPPADAVALAAHTLGPLLALAEGAALRAEPDPRDLLVLRRVAREHPDAAVATRAAAAAVRLATVAGQVDVARAFVRAAQPRAASAKDRALLAWADGDALLAMGEAEEARARYAEASEGLRRARAPRLHATLHRRAGDRFAARGLVRAAEAHYRQARWFYRSEASTLGVAAALRGAADLAVSGGEWVSAGTLHEQVATALTDLGDEAARERANLRLGEATLALARGEYGRAERLLAGLAGLATEDTLLAANVQRRRADLLLRRGLPDEAQAAAKRAADLYASVGEPLAQAACVRLGGDIAAVAGRLADARAAYHAALRLQVRLQDLRGLLRTLEHAAVVEEAAGRPDVARRRREQRAAVVATLGEG